MEYVAYSKPLKEDGNTYYLPVFEGIESDVDVLRTDGKVNRSVVFDESELFAGRIEQVVKTDGIHYLKVQLNPNTKAGANLISDLDFTIENDSAMFFKVQLNRDRVSKVTVAFNSKIDKEL